MYMKPHLLEYWIHKFLADIFHYSLTMLLHITCCTRSFLTPLKDSSSHSFHSKCVCSSLILHTVLYFKVRLNILPCYIYSFYSISDTDSSASGRAGKSPPPFIPKGHRPKASLRLTSGTRISYLAPFSLTWARFHEGSWGQFGSWFLSISN